MRGFLSFALIALLSACGATSDIRIATATQEATPFDFRD
jgi:ABC-type amino acid transport substrate-binding protein